MFQTAESDAHLQLPSYVHDAAEFETWRRVAKQRRCAYCGRTGTLNAHGYLRGYAADGQPDTVRGRRLYCSKRGRRAGCGRTVSVLLSHFIANFMVTTAVLGQFVGMVLSGQTRQASWAEAAGNTMAPASGYRLWRRLSRAQPSLRSTLCRHSPPPASDDTEPFAQLWAHLGSVFDKPDRFAAFQRRFQGSLL